VSSRRETKRRLASGTAKYVFNPVVRGLFRLGLPAPGTAILETIGRKSGRPRRNPVTNGLDGGVFWIVAEHGRRASYVRNIDSNPMFGFASAVDGATAPPGWSPTMIHENDCATSPRGARSRDCIRRPYASCRRIY
jgi:hypothetical protein